MWRRKAAAVLILVIPLFLPLALKAQQKPLTLEQVNYMVRGGFGDESGAKLVEQRGIDFAPSEYFLQTLKTAGASDAFVNALRAAKPPEVAPGLSPAHAALKGGSTTVGPPVSAKKPINQVQVFALLLGQVPGHRVALLVQERGIDFEPTDDYLQEVRLAGGEDELISALKTAKVTKPVTVDPAAQARQVEIRQHIARAAEYNMEKRFVDAEQEVRAALRLDPEDSMLHYDLGAVLGARNDWDGEIVEFREAARLNPDNARAQANLGIALGKKGNYDGMVAEEREALRLNPNFAEAHMALGVGLEKQGNWDGMIAEERAALRLNPKLAEAHYTLGIGLEKQGNWDGMIAEERAALRLNPNLAEAHAALGNGLGKQGNWDGMIVEERKAVLLDPRDARAHAHLGTALGKKKDWDGTIVEDREALRFNPNLAEAHTSLGVALSWKGDWDGATSELRQSVRLDPNNAKVHFGLAGALEKKGDRQGALEEYRMACKLDPKNATYKQNYQRLLQQLNQ